MKFGLFPMILLTFAANVAVPSLGWADWAIATNGEALAGCGGQQVSRAVSSSQTSSPTIIAITDGASSDGSCPGDSGGPTAATYLGTRHSTMSQAMRRRRSRVSPRSLQCTLTTSRCILPGVLQ